MDKWRAIIIMLLLALLTPLSQAQGPFAWEALLYDSAANQLVTVNPLGAATVIPLPAQIAQLNQQAEEFGGLRPGGISPDGHYLALVNVVGAGWLVLVDLWNQTCCQPINNLPLDIDVVDPGGFSPDGNYFAAAYATTSYTGGLMMIDVQSNTVVSTIAAEQFGAIFAIGTDWRADGVYFLPSCYACEPPLNGTLMRWDPYTNQLSATNEFVSFVGDSLAATGEWLVAEENLSFPVLGEPVGMFPPANVVHYFANNPASAVPVYFDPNNLDLMQPRWVMNGDAFFVPDASGGAVVGRDGSLQTVTLPPADFLVGTPDGWLAITPDHRLLHVTEAIGAGFAANDLTRFVSRPMVVESTPLSPNLSGGFPVVEPPLSQVVTCPGAPPPRLVINRAGRVTPGDPNRLRAQPTTSSPAVGQIPGGGVFQVLQGPVCADGLAWWRVNYQNTEGWTAEGQGNTYWLEPV